MTTANSVYEAQKQTGSSGSMSEDNPRPAPSSASSSGYGYSSYNNRWGGKLPKGTLVRFHVDTNGVGVIVEWDSKTKVYGVKWGEDKAICKGYRDSTIVALSAEECAGFYFKKYMIDLDEHETAKSVVKKEILGLEEQIKLAQERLTEAKAVVEAIRREEVKPVVASYAGGW